VMALHQSLSLLVGGCWFDVASISLRMHYIDYLLPGAWLAVIHLFFIFGVMALHQSLSLLVGGCWFDVASISLRMHYIDYLL
ncbi:hypothetical protein, partial [Salmonella enterica]|uniref:hypothetical protein n=1 Tax=Salmonella enterica TaxID=28901 RepID=UPI0026151024